MVILTRFPSEIAPLIERGVRAIAATIRKKTSSRKLFAYILNQLGRNPEIGFLE